MQVILERAGMQMDADGCRRTEADGEGMAGGVAGGECFVERAEDPPAPVD